MGFKINGNNNINSQQGRTIKINLKNAQFLNGSIFGNNEALEILKQAQTNLGLDLNNPNEVIPEMLKGGLNPLAQQPISSNQNEVHEPLSGDYRTYTQTATDNGFTRTFSDGEVVNYDTNGHEISGTNAKGTEHFTVEQLNNGGFRRNYTFICDNTSDGYIDYDAQGRITRDVETNNSGYNVEYNQDGSAVRKYFDAQSNLTGKVTNYDSRGKETGGVLANGNTFTTQYNDDGSRVRYFTETSENGGGKYEYHYDAQGRTTRFVETNNSGYNVEYNQDGSAEKIYFDAQGNLTGEVTNYDSHGKETGGVLANGNTFTTRYNDDGSRVNYFTKTSANGGGKYEYHYDAQGRITRFVDTNNSGYNVEYNQDGSAEKIYFDADIPSGAVEAPRGHSENATESAAIENTVAETYSNGKPKKIVASDGYTWTYDENGRELSRDTGHGFRIDFLENGGQRRVYKVETSNRRELVESDADGRTTKSVTRQTDGQYLVLEFEQNANGVSVPKTRTLIRAEEAHSLYGI